MPAAPAAAKPAKTTALVYGRQVPKATPKISLELAAYREDWSKDSGGLGREAHFKNAFRLLWPNFVWNEWTEVMCWAWCTYRWITVIGHERAGKTYNFARFAFLDYLSDPENTLTTLCTVTFEGLKLRMWPDLLKGAEEGTATHGPLVNLFTYRTTTNELRVFPTEAKGDSGEKYQIHGMAIATTKDAEARIRGGHAPRRVIVVDEANNAPPPIFSAVINPMSAPFGRCAFLTNPVEKASEFGNWCIPKNPGSVNGLDLAYETTKGGICIQLNGLLSPNVRAGKVVVPGLLTTEMVNDVRTVHGEGSVQWYALILGQFPPDGMISRIFPSSVIEAGKKERRWDFRPTMCASLDPAFEFDECVLSFGELGTPIYGEKNYAINCTESTTIQFEVGPTAEPKDYQIARKVKDECTRRGVRPEHFIMDKTGGGRGVFAILQVEWSGEVQGIEYGGKATERPIRADRPDKASDMYLYFVTELWFRASEYVRSGIITGIGKLDAKTDTDLTGRRYELKQTTEGRKVQAESKVDYKKRLGRSPDHGDTFCQFAELLARLGTFPGGTLAKFSAGAAAAKQKERAKRTSEAYAEEREFSHFGT